MSHEAAGAFKGIRIRTQIGLRRDNRQRRVFKALPSRVVAPVIVTALIEPGRPHRQACMNKVSESFDGKSRDDRLSLE